MKLGSNLSPRARRTGSHNYSGGRIARGTYSSLNANGIAISSFTPASGSTLLLAFAFDPLTAGDPEAAAAVVQWNGVDMTSVLPGGVADGAGLYSLYLFAAYNVAAVAGTFNLDCGGDPGYRAALALELTGVTASPFDKRNSDSGTGTSAGSTITPTTSQANEFLLGLVMTAGPPTDSAGTWINGFTVGQRVGANDSPDGVTISEGYKEATAIGTYQAQKTSMVSRDWAAAIATFKEA